MTGFLPCQVLVNINMLQMIIVSSDRTRTTPGFWAVAKKPTNEVAASSLKAAVLLT